MNDQNSNIDFNQVIKMAQTLSQSQDKVEPIALSPIDQAINNQQMRIMKATLPYIDYPYQRKMATIIKILELQKTMLVFDPSSELHTTIQEKKALNKLELLKDIRNSCDEPHQKKLNILISILNMQSTMERMKNNALLLESNEGETIQSDTLQSETINVESAKAKASKQEETAPGDSYSQFMNMVNKIIDEKKGE